MAISLNGSTPSKACLTTTHSARVTTGYPICLIYRLVWEQELDVRKGWLAEMASPVIDWACGFLNRKIHILKFPLSKFATIVRYWMLSWSRGICAAICRVKHSKFSLFPFYSCHINILFVSVMLDSVYKACVHHKRMPMQWYLMRLSINWKW